ncbi:MAG: hypothetical protein AB7T22_12835 [Calditrichaceae bacterium]
MISCDRTKSLLSEYLSNSLSPDIRKMTDDHLQVCQNCNEVFSQVKLLTQKLSKMPRVSISDDFEARLRQQIINKDPIAEKSNIFSIRRLSFGFSGIALAAAMYFFIATDFTSTNTAAPPAALQHSSTISRSDNPVYQVNQETSIASEATKINASGVKDSLIHEPAVVDQNRINLVGQEK